MIYLLSWRGRGFVAFLLIFLPVAFLLAASAIGEDAMLPAFGIGWLISGIICFVFGRRWNRPTNNHFFGPLKLQTWGVIFGAIGAVLLWLFVSQLIVERQMRRPTKRPSAAAHARSFNPRNDVYTKLT